MNTSENTPDEVELGDLLASIDRDAPQPDRAFLDALRERSTAAFQTGTPPVSLRKSPVKLSSLRWIAAVAALLLVGVVFAQWIVSMNRDAVVVEPVPEDKFVLGDKLTDDGRIGKVTDSQGIVSVKPVLAERWSPAQAQLVLKPGDWLRTDSRGANAIALRLLPATGVSIGPHSTVELVKPNEIKLLAGELEIDAAIGAPVELHGPNQQILKIEGRQFIRIEKEKLVLVEKEPQWLQGFKGTSANESLGSLIATVDGRNVPLTVGYHRVTVDIRDQIARTEIEESFVNRTDGVLEGVFHFPLPQDASISGFGMWIGDNLVEADVVEKQRAREIYETILREKRDPGLLEWAGGNIFKARVYPIPARSEKRIKISYTQVLPLKGNRYRYSYALQSELLKQHPLRDLKIDVKIHSAAGIQKITSPTHDTRLTQTGHSGHVEFAAQEYTPTRDFEAVVEVAGRREDVVVIPHRRGDDGYFLVQLSPPDGTGNWERPLIPNGDPLNLLLLADTSASMDRGQRATQNALLASLLGALTPKDTINVAACDVNCDWIFEKPVAVTPENIALVRDTLLKRVSLGWTDLDKAIASTIARCVPGTHAIYLGDGISTSGAADPVAFAKRLAKLHEGKPGTFHAIALGSSFEPAALKAIASLGGGSLRRVGGEQGPQRVVAELLTEIAAPALRNLKLEITGVRTARVYPDDLPNVAAGSQQILLGRYLPEGKDQQGDIVVTGILGSKPVRYVSKFSLKDAESGNSFLPRLWARMHLDKLLEQGSSAAIQQEIIALSEEFNIITPYTSLLVLESDADRERFAVKRQFKMRDGEKFFADGRDSAAFELKRKQMRAAGDYRTALRRKVLSQLQSLGRDARIMENPLRSDGRSGVPFSSKSRQSGLRFDMPIGGKFAIIENFALSADWDNTVPGVPPPPDGSYRFDKDDLVDERDALRSESSPDSSPVWPKDSKFQDNAFETIELPSLRRQSEGYIDLRKALSDTEEYYDESPMASSLPYSIGEPSGIDSAEMGRFSYSRRRPSGLPWLGNLFPQLPTPARAWKEPKSNWPAAALALSKSLLRRDKLAQHKGGLVIARTHEYFDSRDNSVTAQATRVELVSPTAWLTRSTPSTGPVSVQWCDAKELGAINTAYRLGRVRASNAFDLQRPPLELSDDSMTGLHIAYANYTPTVEMIAKDRTLLILKHKSDRYAEARYVIDTARNLLLSTERRHREKVQSTMKFDDFIEVAGTWWARKIETLDEAGKRTALETQTIADVPAGAFAGRMKMELAAKERVLFLKQSLPKVAEAKAAVSVGKATIEDRAVLTLHFAATQQWARAKEHLAECERLAGDKPGMRWLTNAFLLVSRQHEELRKRLLKDAAGVDIGSKANAHFLAQSIFSQAQQVLPITEQLLLWDALEPIHKEQPAHLNARKSWRNQRLSLLQQAGETELALALAKALAVEYPRDANAQYRYAQQLASTEDYAAAYAWLDRALAAKWEPSQEDMLRGQYADLLGNQGRFRELADFLAKWIERNPDADRPYAQYLAALIRSNLAEKAEALVTEWLRDGRAKGELARPTAARLTAAVGFALGQGYGFNTNRIDERWHAPLAETARHFARRDESGTTAETILQHWRFAGTDAGRAVRKALAKELAAEIGTMAPERIAQYLNWAWTDAGLETEDWAKIAAALRKRWDAEKDADAKHALGQVLLKVLHRFIGEDDLEFLRVQYKGATEEYRRQYAVPLFEMLLARPWRGELEDELFALLDKLAPPEELAGGLASRVTALHRLTDTLVEARYQAALKKLEHPEKLPRTELQTKQAELRKQAREGFVDRLRAEAAKHAKPFASWVMIERLWLEMQLERDLKAVATECWTILDGAAPKANPEDDSTKLEVAIDAALRQRAFVTLMNIASRKGAEAALIESLLKHIDTQIAAHADEPRWKAEKYRLFIALDRSQELEAELRRWIAGAAPEHRWQLALGYLLAEQGKTADAIKLFEAVEAADELTPDAYRSLADWYLVENRREASEKARAALYQTTDENALHRKLLPYLRPWQNPNGHMPSQLDPEVLRIFKVLFEKSEYPQSYLGTLQQFYAASRDFRLLAMLPDGVVGHSAGAVYGFLTSMSAVLAEIRDEAVADELIARLAEVRKLRTTPIDLPALDLLEVQVERRAAEIQNQPGPHATNALAALERAFKREWTAGEPRFMAEFLANLGIITRPELAKEQLRQLEVLHRDAKAGTFDRLHIALQYATALHGGSKQQAGIDVLEAALKEFETSHAGTLPVSANGALGQFLSFLENAKQYERGEKYLLAQLRHPVHAQQRTWVTNRLHALYREALVHGGDVSLGKGAALYKALVAKLFADLGTTDQNQRYALLLQVVRIYRTAHELNFAGVPGDLKAFAFERLPAILKDQAVNHDDVVREVANALHDLAGPREGIAFLLDRVDGEPDWLRYENRNVWNQYSDRLGVWRTEAKDLGELEPRLLKYVLVELRSDLRTRESFGRSIYDRRHSHFWAAKEADFAKVADEVYAERKASGASVEYIAEYLFDALPRQKRAIEILFAAHESKLLSDTGEWHLITYLQRTDRYAESIPLLVAHVRRRPEYLPYRTLLMRAYFKTGKQTEVLTLWKETDEYFRAKERWSESVSAMLAESTLENRLFVQAVAYYKELLAQYQRSQPGRGADALHRHYTNAADAYAGLGQTKEAVDMASAAVVVWPSGHARRKETLDHLVKILEGAPKLAEYIAALDAEKLQSAVVRKALGQALIRKNEHARAIPQLRLAGELQPNDAEVYELLIACFDKIGDKEGAVLQLFDAVELSRREIKLYAELGRRFTELKRPTDAERAYTSTVEMLPNESESHALLAEVREKQNRWPEAIAHWERVAEIRKLEPTGLVKLAAAQLHEKEWAKAAESVKKLRARTWPARFNEVEKQTRELEKLLEGAKK